MDNTMDKYLVKIDPSELIIGNTYVFKYNPPLEGDDRDLIPGDDPNVNINKREGILSNIDRDMGREFYTFKNVTYRDEPERPMKKTGQYVGMMDSAQHVGHILEFYAIPRRSFKGAGVKRRTRRNMRVKRRKTKRNRKSKRRRRYM